MALRHFRWPRFSGGALGKDKCFILNQLIYHTRASCLDVITAAICCMAELVTEAHGWTAQAVSTGATASVASTQAGTYKESSQRLARSRTNPKSLGMP